jgi:predicted MPP superfamily phosphohydrolase
MKLRKRWWFWPMWILLLLGGCVFLQFENKSLVTSRYVYTNQSLPASLEGFRIVHLSDLHSTSFGKEQSRLIEQISSLQPNLIVLTGDLIDARRTKKEEQLSPALKLAEQAARIAPVYYVPGNHEADSRLYPTLRKELSLRGVTVLEGERVKLEDSVYLIGMDDPLFYRSVDDFAFESRLRELIPSDGFSILLSHRPERISAYAEAGADLVFSGHAHGGQIRFPWGGGLIAPGQGFFPRYTSGLYREGDTTMAVSRGLGNSLFPFRVWNRPEILLLEINPPESS